MASSVVRVVATAWHHLQSPSLKGFLSLCNYLFNLNWGTNEVFINISVYNHTKHVTRISKLIGRSVAWDNSEGSLEERDIMEAIVRMMIYVRVLKTLLSLALSLMIYFYMVTK